MVKIYKQKLTNLQQEILSFLFIKSNKEFNARRLALELEVSQPAISKALPALEKLNYINIQKDKESGRFSVSLNKNNSLVIGMKRAENLKTLYESGLVEFLNDEFPGATIILFGSHAYGVDSWFGENHESNSDIDIAVIGSKEKNINLKKFEDLLGREIIINFYPNFKEIHEHLKNNILNGILLKGGVVL